MKKENWQAEFDKGNGIWDKLSPLVKDKRKLMTILVPYEYYIKSFIRRLLKSEKETYRRDLETLYNNRIWEIASGILKSIGVKNIKTTYYKNKNKGKKK